MTSAVSSLMGTLRCVIRQPSYGPPGVQACSVGLALPGTPTKTTTCHVSKVTASLGGDVPSVLEMLKSTNTRRSRVGSWAGLDRCHNVQFL